MKNTKTKKPKSIRRVVFTGGRMACEFNNVNY